MPKKYRLLTVAMLALLVAPLFSVTVSAEELAPNDTCQQYTKSVQLSPSIPFLNFDLVGTLCYRGQLADQVVQVLIHGAGYNSYYWDFPQDPNTYSYVKDAIAKGYATFNVDRIGSGQSGKPDGFLVNVDNSAFTLHQLVGSLRDGSLTGHAFTTVAGVGHSFGSLIAVAQATQFQNDYDAIVLTGFLHNLGTGAGQAPQFAIPTQFDPQLASYPANYFSLVPGARAILFYNTAFADPAIIARDEQERDAIALGLLLDIGRHFSPESLAITKPVFIILGEQDFIYCGNGIDCTDHAAVAAHESAFFSPAAQLEVQVVPNLGHDLVLHENGGKQSTKDVLQWIKKTL